MKLAPQTIEALAQVISGGSGNDPTPSIGVYRSGPRLESFMRACGVSMSVGSGSRLPALIAALEDVNRREDEKVLREIVERAADPRDFVTEPDKHVAVVAYLNQFLRYDDLELQSQGGRPRRRCSSSTASTGTWNARWRTRMLTRRTP